MTFWKAVLAVVVSIEISMLLNILTKWCIRASRRGRYWLLPAILFPLLLIACLQGNYQPPREASIGEPGAKRTQQLLELMPNSWRLSGYDRPDDLIVSWPVRLAVAGDNTACIISDGVASMWKQGYVVACEHWRVRRG